MDSERDPDACGCEPTPLPRAAFGSQLSRRRTLGLAVAGLTTLAAGSALVGPRLPAAFADDYPTWEDVLAAKQNEAAKAAEVTRIQGLIEALKNDLAAKQLAAEQASNEFYEAQQAFFDASYRADQLQLQADEEAVRATDAATKAATVAAEIYRNGGDDTALELFFSGSAENADDLLAKLGTMDQLLERNEDLYAEAVTARDSAQSLSDQAAVARDERDRLQVIAEEKMVAARDAEAAAEAALQAQTENLATLEAQLAALQDTTSKTVAEYEEGVRVREEAARKAREEAARRAREEAERLAQQQQSSGGGGGGSGGGGGGGGGGSGWVRPSGGWRTSGYGPRSGQCGSSYCASSWHLGVDMASGCGAGIYAAAGGTVVYSGWNGGYGYYIKIDHGGGIATGYAHCSRLFVGWGQWVNAGALIAAEGTTGNSFGCHLHYEVYNWGRPINPSDFMWARGVGL